MIPRLLIPNVFASVLAMLSLFGCGDGAPPVRSSVTGMISFQGQPVPEGTVTFEPDSSRGGSGPQAIAIIKDGRYQTPSEFGASIGPVILRIEGFGVKPKLGNGISGFPDRLFPAFEHSTTITTGTNEVNVAVPEEIKPKSKKLTSGR